MVPPASRWAAFAAARWCPRFLLAMRHRQETTTCVCGGVAVQHSLVQMAPRKSSRSVHPSFPPYEDSVSYADSNQITIAKVRRVSRGLAPAVVHELAKVAQRGRLVGFRWVRARHEEHACVLGRPRRAAVLCTRHSTIQSLASIKVMSAETT